MTVDDGEAVVDLELDVDRRSLADAAGEGVRRARPGVPDVRDA